MKIDTEEQRFPEGWDEERVKALLDYYESQSDEDAAVEDEYACRPNDTSEPIHNKEKP